MPTGKILRRKRTSPTAIVGNEQIGPWIRKFEASQEQGRRKSAKTTATSNMDASSSSQLQAGAVSNAIAMKEKATFLSLPREVQSAIIKEVSLTFRGDVLVLALLCV